MLQKKIKDRIYKVLLLLGIVAIMISCDEDFFISEVHNVNVPGSKQQLVVNSYISPQDTLIRVWVHFSSPYLKPRPFDVFDKADVTIGRKGGTMHKMEYSEMYNSFILDPEILRPEAGNYYVLKVKAHSGETAEAECFIPPFQISEVTFSKSSVYSDNHGNNYMDLDWKIQVNDSSGEKYFRTLAYTVHYNSYYDYEGNFRKEKYLSELYLQSGSPFFIDNNGSRHIFRSRRYFNFEEIPIPGRDNPKTDTLFVEVLQTNRDYYLFHKSAENYFYYNLDFPFAEAVYIYSNFSGAMGVFAGYNKKTYILE
jgi:hypothetical protein